MAEALHVISDERELLKQTLSRCLVCRAPAKARVVRIGKQVYLERSCPKHGEQSVCISSDARFYWVSKGADGCCGTESNSNCCVSGSGDRTAVIGRNAKVQSDTPFERLSTCLALIEIVNSCNLSCPTCYANSPKMERVDALPLDQIKSRIQGVIDRKGGIEILQLSGGEPTLHPQFFELIDWVKANRGIDYLLINSNGVRIASDDYFVAELAQRVAYDNLQLYLQFDGTSEAGQRELRGADLRALRSKVIERAAKIKLPLTLAMTVTEANLDSLWEAISFGLKFPNVRGVTFQPLIHSGRNPNELLARAGPISTAEIIIGCVEQSNGKLRYDDFTPLPCGDPNCATIGYLLKIHGATKSISEYVDFKTMQGFLSDRIRYSIEDLARCGCESEPLGSILKELELDESHTFRIFVKPFMDARSWDQDRIDRCCTHVIRPDGKLDSFCRYYSGFSDLVEAPK